LTVVLSNVFYISVNTSKGLIVYHATAGKKTIGTASPGKVRETEDPMAALMKVEK